MTRWKGLAVLGLVESQADGVRLAERIESRYMVPTDFSPLK
jgi:hypothetical protein